MAYRLLDSPEADVSPVYPYFPDDDAMQERQEELESRRKAVTPEVIAKLEADRQAYLRAKRV